MNAVLADFIDGWAQRGITLDPFQIEACSAIDAGDVLVCAPTGSGKTVVALYAVERALARNTRCVYTAPIKALSNQKFAEIVARHGEEAVGLLTGDVTINREAPILVMTTEVLRNMLFAKSEDVDGIGYVVLDEVHYLADRERGPVWEEVILTLPEHVRLVSLSATVANVGEISGWLESVRGSTTVVTSDKRPVPLRQHVAVGGSLYPLYARNSEDPHGAMMDALLRLDDRDRPLSTGDRRRVLSLLEREDMLPAIEFIFSRKGCTKAVEAFIRRDITLTTAAQQREIRALVDEARESLSPADQRAVGFDAAARGLIRGYGAHHAGVFPAIKTLTENLMERGLLSVVFATGTLALGIDMPVRSVVLEDLRRWDGNGFVDLTATEYIQLIGRAGRRGRDTVGHAVVVGRPRLDPYALARLGAGTVEPLLSAFQPSYNTVVNLLATSDYRTARALLGRSLAQYQRNADLVELEQRRARVSRRIEEESKALQCSHGDIVEYVRRRAHSGRAAKAARKAAKQEYRRRIEASFDAAANGRVYAAGVGGELTYVLVLSAGHKLRVIDWYGNVFWLRRDALSSELREVAHLELPQGRSLKAADTREDVADMILDAVKERVDLGIDRDLLGSWSRFAVGEDLSDHPCHSCPHLKKHLRAGEALVSLDARLEELDARMAGYEDSVGREFDATARVLRRVGIVHDAGDGVGLTLSARASGLRRLHCENDLLLYSALSALQEGTFDAAGFAGWATMFMADDRLGTRMPRGGVHASAVRDAARELVEIRNIEAEEGVERTRDITPGCVDVIEAWANGATLADCLEASSMAAGDFISTVRRVIDLLGSIAACGEGTWVETIALQARSAIRRDEVLA